MHYMRDNNNPFIAVICAIFLALLIMLITNGGRAEEEVGPYLNVYIPVSEGEADYHDPYADDYCYGGMHHRAGENCPDSYYVLLQVWQYYGEMYEDGLINLNQLKEMEYWIFFQKKGVWLYEDVMEACDKFARKYGIGYSYDAVAKEEEMPKDDD